MEGLSPPFLRDSRNDRSTRWNLLLACQGPVRLDAHRSNMTIGRNSLPPRHGESRQAVPPSADPFQLEPIERSARSERLGGPLVFSSDTGLDSAPGEGSGSRESTSSPLQTRVEPSNSSAWRLSGSHAATVLNGTLVSGGDVLGSPPQALLPWHFLYFLPLPHEHGSLRPSFEAPWTKGSRVRAT